jgi:HK97 family phage major capsid protein
MNKKEFDATKIAIAEKIGKLKKRSDLNDDAKASFEAIETAFGETLTSIESLFEKGENVSDIETKLKALSEKFEAVEKAKHGDAIEAIKTAIEEMRGKIKVGHEEKGTSWVDFYTEHAEKFKKFRENRQDIPFNEMKAATLITTTTNILPAPNPYIPATTILPGIVPVTLPSQRIIDYISKGTINTPNIVLINEVNGEGDAAFVPEGGLKPLMDFDFKTEDAKAKKIAVRLKISDEMLQDVAFLASETERLISQKLQRFLRTKILTGTGTGDEIKGVAAYAGGYTQTCLNGKITAPGLPEVLRAAASQIRSLGFDGKLVAFVNPCDNTENVLRKDSTGQLLDVTGVLEGIEVIETGEIAAGNFLIGDISKYKLYVYKDYSIRYGYGLNGSNSDFETNVITIVAEMRVIGIMSQNEIGALVKDSIATVIAAIETP